MCKKANMQIKNVSVDRNGETRVKTDSGFSWGDRRLHTVPAPGAPRVAAQSADGRARRMGLKTERGLRFTTQAVLLLAFNIVLGLKTERGLRFTTQAVLLLAFNIVFAQYTIRRAY